MFLIVSHIQITGCWRDYLDLWWWKW